MLLFTAVGLLCLLLHTANGSLNTTRLAPSQSASNQANYSSSASLAPKGKDSLPSSEQKSPLLTASANHSLLANETTLTSNAAVRLETTTQNIWTLDPKDASGNNDTFAQLLGLGLDKSEISIFGVGPGMYDTDFFQVNMTGEILSKFKPGVGASSLPLILHFSRFL